MRKILPLDRIIHKSNYGKIIVAFDPGETTGVAVWDGEKISYTGQLEKTNDIIEACKIIRSFFSTIGSDIDLVVYENYIIYEFKSDAHKWNDVHTAKVIGSICTCAVIYDCYLSTRIAQPVKKFITDEKLKSWGLYSKGMVHGRDATRHLLFELINGRLLENKSKKKYEKEKIKNKK